MGNNQSTSELAVYQSAITKIGQDIKNSSSNFNNQVVNVDQEIHVNNEPDDNLCDIRNLRMAECIKDCINNPNQSDTRFDSCISACNSLDCDEIQFQEAVKLQERTGVMECNVRIANDSTTNIGSTQIAKTNTTAQMTTAIANQFDSEVDRKIAQKNADLNFGQFNSSTDRTSVSQNVKNSINNAINTSAQNVSSQLSNAKQVINFTNRGFIRTITDPNASADCNELGVQCLPPKQGDVGTCDFSNKAFSDLQSQNDASSVLESFFTSDVVNDLSSKFKLDLSQTNQGVKVGELWWIIAMVSIAAILGKVLLVYAASKTKSVILQISFSIVILGYFIAYIAIGMFIYRIFVKPELSVGENANPLTADDNQIWAIKINSGAFCRTPIVGTAINCDVTKVPKDDNHLQFELRKNGNGFNIISLNNKQYLTTITGDILSASSDSENSKVFIEETKPDSNIFYISTSDRNNYCKITKTKTLVCNKKDKKDASTFTFSLVN